MWFFLLILLAFLLIIFSPVVKVWRAVRKFQSDYNNTMGNAQQNDNKADNKTSDVKERYRRYSSETGEYVNYEEIEGRPQETIEPEHSTESTSSSSRYQEEIVSDAEFEDIE